jgi:hypothetical protein
MQGKAHGLRPAAVGRLTPLRVSFTGHKDKEAGLKKA